MGNIGRLLRVDQFKTGSSSSDAELALTFPLYAVVIGEPTGGTHNIRWLSQVPDVIDVPNYGGMRQRSVIYTPDYPHEGDICCFIEPDELPDECAVRLAELALKGELDE